MLRWGRARVPPPGLPGCGCSWQEAARGGEQPASGQEQNRVPLPRPGLRPPAREARPAGGQQPQTGARQLLMDGGRGLSWVKGRLPPPPHPAAQSALGQIPGHLQKPGARLHVCETRDWRSQPPAGRVRAGVGDGRTGLRRPPLPPTASPPSPVTRGAVDPGLKSQSRESRLQNPGTGNAGPRTPPRARLRGVV